MRCSEDVLKCGVVSDRLAADRVEVHIIHASRAVPALHMPSWPPPCNVTPALLSADGKPRLA